MKRRKLLALMLTISMVLLIALPVAGAGPGHDSGKVIHGPRGDRGNGSGKDHATGSGKGHSGFNSTLGTAPDSDLVTTEEEGGSGKGGGNQGGVNRPGEPKGGGGSGGHGKDPSGGLLTLVVTLNGLPGDGSILPNVILNLVDEYGNETEVAQEASTFDGSAITATLEAEASGDYVLRGEPVPGYLTPEKELRLVPETTDDSGVTKEIYESLTYVAEAVSVTGVALDTGDLQLVGDYYQLVRGYSAPVTAFVEPANANNQEVSWTSDAPEVASVVADAGDSRQAEITASSSGIAEITVTTDDGGYADSVQIQVISIASLTNPAEISAIPDEVVLFPGTLLAIMDDGSSREFPVTWEGGLSFWQVPTAPEATYTFSGSVVGTELTATLTITVDQSAEPAVPVENLLLDTTIASIYVGETVTVTATIYPENATLKDVVWTSSDESVAAVDSSGTVSGLAAGTVNITAETLGLTADGATIRVSCTVQVLPVLEPSLIFPTSEAVGFSEPVGEFTSREEVYINVANLIDYISMTAPTHYYIKVENKGSSRLLGSGEVTIDPDGAVYFNLYQASPFSLTNNYSNEYFVSMSTDPSYPLDDEKTLKTNFRIGSAVPTLPKENITVTTEVINGYLDDPDGLIFLLCRELDEPITETTWQDYLDLEHSTFVGDPSAPGFNPYDPGFNLLFTDEVKMMGAADAYGLVIWEQPREKLKLGGYVLLEVTPAFYEDNLNEIDPLSADGSLLKEVHLDRNGEIVRHVVNNYVGPYGWEPR